MTYFQFLGLFICFPLICLALLLLFFKGKEKTRKALTQTSFPLWIGVALHIFLAVSYTTPWDNYLVATSVWSYESSLVSGIILGWVPLEEYCFFVLQTILTSFWLFICASYISIPNEKSQSWLRFQVTFFFFCLWILCWVVFFFASTHWNYLTLILLWALPPILLQIAFGADFLWRARRLVSFTILSATLYLSVVDSLAIWSKTWTINPDKSLGILFGGILPLEEMIFFLCTNILVVFGLYLFLSPESQSRLPQNKFFQRNSCQS